MLLITIGGVAAVCLIAGLFLFFSNPDRSRAPEHERYRRKQLRLAGMIVAGVAVVVLGLAMTKQFHLRYLIEKRFRPKPQTDEELAAMTDEPKPAGSPSDKDAADESQARPMTKLDLIMQKVDAMIKVNPKDVKAYEMRGSIYFLQRKWQQAEEDYNTAIKLDETDSKARYDLAEVSFQQRKYDVARSRFLDVKGDSDLVDLASYKAYLCDLFGGHEEAAAKQLDAFNQVGSNPSYYFANMAWCLTHHDQEGVDKWNRMAVYIYAKQRGAKYAQSLVDYMKTPQSFNAANAGGPSATTNSSAANAAPVATNSTDPK